MEDSASGEIWRNGHHGKCGGEGIKINMEEGHQEEYIYISREIYRRGCHGKYGEGEIKEKYGGGRVCF